jgi:hypothetical protein
MTFYKAAFNIKLHAYLMIPWQQTPRQREARRKKLWRASWNFFGMRQSLFLLSRGELRGGTKDVVSLTQRSTEL